MQRTDVRIFNLLEIQIFPTDSNSRSLFRRKASGTQSVRHQRAPSRANIDARRIEITAILDVPWLWAEEAGTIGAPRLRICLRSRSSIVACSMKQMHIGGALFGGIALRRAQLGLHIYLYIRGAGARVRAAGTRSKTPCGAGYLHIKVTMVSRAVVELRYPSTDRARGREFSSHSGPSPIYSLALEWTMKWSSFTAPLAVNVRI